MPKIITCMGKNDFVAASYVTYVDFYFFEFLQLCIFISEGKVLTQFPSLKAYNERMKKIEGFAEYIEDPDCPINTLDFNNKSAKINGRLNL